MVSSHLLFSLIQCNAQYLRQLSRYFNQLLGDFGPHQTKALSTEQKVRMAKELYANKSNKIDDILKSLHISRATS